jgi:hypothetical protein
MSENPFDPLDPTDSLDEEDLLSEQLSDLDEPRQIRERITASELEQLRSIDDEIREETPERQRRSSVEHEVLAEHDEPDEEAELVGDELPASEDQLGPEERAMHTTINPPGVTDDESDGYGDDEAG